MKRTLPEYKNRIIISTLLYIPAVFIGYWATVDNNVHAMIYHVFRAIIFYIIMYQYYKYFKLKYR